MPLPFYGALIFAGIRVLSLAITAFLLPRGKFRDLHYSLLGLIKSWDGGGRYLIIAFHGYSYVPGDMRHDSIFAWFPGYPAAIRAVAWASRAGAAGAGLGVTIAAGMAAAWELTRLGMTKNALIDAPTSFVILTLLVIAAAVALAVCSLTQRMPVYVHVYTLAVVLVALTAGPDFFGGKPRFLLPAVLLGLPLAVSWPRREHGC